MKYTFHGISTKIFLVLSIVLLSASILYPAIVRGEPASIWTDKPDYSPEETVIISGGGFLPNNVVVVIVTRPNSVLDSWNVVSDEYGAFTTSYQLDGITGIYAVTATDGINAATTTFTDTTYKVTFHTIPTAGTVALDVDPGPHIPHEHWTENDGDWIMYVTSKTYSVTANPPIGYAFSSWTVSGGVAVGSSTSQTTTMTASADGTITANFVAAPTQHTVSFAQSGCGLGYNPTVEYWIDSGSHTTTAVPFSVQVDDSHQISYIYQLIVPGAAGVQYVRTGVSPASPQTVAADLTVTGTYKTMYNVSFVQSGCGATVTVAYSLDNLTSGSKDAPFWFWVDKDQTITYTYPAVISGAPGVQYVLTGVSPASPQEVTAPLPIAGSYKTQYLLTVKTNGLPVPYSTGVYLAGSITPTTDDFGVSSINDGATDGWRKWFDASPSGTDTIGVDSPVAGAVGTQYAFKDWDDLTTTNPHATLALTSPITLVVDYVTQFKVHFGWSGLDADADAKTVVTITVGGTPITKLGADEFYDEWLDSGTTVSYAYEDPIEITADVKQYRLDSVAGTSTDPSHDFDAISGAITEAAAYQAQFYITFDQTGVGSDFTGTVVTIDGTDYALAGAYMLPASFWWDENSEHSFEFKSPLSVDTDKQYVWTSTSGLSTLQSDSDFEVTTFGSIIGNYKTQYRVQIKWSGLTGDATGKVVSISVDGGPNIIRNAGDDFFDEFIDEGKEVIYEYEIFVASIIPGEQFWLKSVTGPSSPFQVSGPTTVTGNYLRLPLSSVTTSSLCYFDIDNNPSNDQQFKLIFTQDPTNLAKYKLTASNPGQFYYNVFYVGTPDESVSLTITIPYPFVTQGAVPIHVYSDVSIVGGCFVPSGELSGFTINPLTFPTPIPGGQIVTITGDVPLSGLVYVTIHLDYGLKKESGYTKLLDETADNTGSSKDIPQHGPYIFSVGGDISDSQTIENVNVFKHDPGFAGIVTDASGTPVAGVKVEIRGPTGTLLATVYTDEDGFYFFYYKYTGKAAIFTVKLPAYKLSQAVTVKANAIVEVNFTLP